MKAFWKGFIVVVSVLVVLLCVGLFFFVRTLVAFDENPLRNQSASVVVGPENFSEVSKKEIREPHWNQMPLTYQIFNCSGYEARRIIDAFVRLENETGRVVSFASMTRVVEDRSGTVLVQETGNASIDVVCHPEYGKMQEDGYIVAGDSGYFTFSDAPFDIVKAKVNFYGIGPNTYSGGCPVYPDIEMHEILHAFGFQHVEQYNHIMNPTHAYCPSKVNEDVIAKLREVYLR